MQGRCPICGRVGALHRPCADHPEWVHLDAEELTARARTPLLGRIIDDRHAVVGVLGRGGFGAVFSGVHLMLGQIRAIKLLHKLEDAQARDRFFAEARIVATLVSDYTVKVLDFGLANLPPLGEVPFIAMELVHGRTLHDHLRTYDRLTLGHAATLLEHAASSLDEAHRLGVIHRDLKPANIMLTDHLGAPRAKVIDFGVARIEGSERGGEQPAFGTPAYMAPEMWIIDGEVDHRADVYALGVIMFRALAGDRPYLGNDQEALREAHLRAPVPSLARFGVPERVAAVVERALAKRPVERWSTAGEMALAFSMAVQAETFVPASMGSGVTLLGEPLPGAPGESSQPTPLLASGEVQVRANAWPGDLSAPKVKRWPWFAALGAAAVAGGLWWSGLLSLGDPAESEISARNAASGRPVRVPVSGASVAIGAPSSLGADAAGQPPATVADDGRGGAGQPALAPLDDAREAPPKMDFSDRGRSHRRVVPTEGERGEPPRPDAESAIRADAVRADAARADAARAEVVRAEATRAATMRRAATRASATAPSKRGTAGKPVSKASASTAAVGLGPGEQLVATALEGLLDRCDCSQARTQLVRLPPDHPTTRALRARVQRCRKPTLDEACAPR